MRVLVYIGSHDNNSINAAFERVDSGDEVTIVGCDNSLGLCRDNYYGNSQFCKLCMHSNFRLWGKRLKQRGAKVLLLSDIICEEDKKESERFVFQYDSVPSLKEIRYKGIEIGYGAFSTYVSVTRNVMPEITKAFTEYANFLMKKEIVLINAIDRLINQCNPELMIFHNSRFAEFKPMLGLARKHGIEFVSTEEVYYNGKILKDDFINVEVHSISTKCQKCIDNWEVGCDTEEEKNRIGKSFFENRRNSIAAGDKVYTADQEKGLLPGNFQKEKEIISIFNSSEDEFCSVSSEYDKYSLYENQYIALKTIFEHYKNDKTKHFYLRIHPNLKVVPYISHTKLYELQYDNVTVISPSSPVDSYVLMDNSDKIIVFNSTMAIESAYWGKPVIELSKYMWSLMDVVYTPETEDELWQLIETKDLKCKYNDNCLKYAYWVLHPNYEEEKYIQCENVDINLFGIRLHQEHQFLKVLGSTKLNSILRILLTRRSVMKLLKPFTYFTSLPCTVD